MTDEELLAGVARIRHGRVEGPGRVALAIMRNAAELTASAGGWRVAVQLAPPLPFSLRVRTLQDADYYDFFGNPEITFRDEAFDETLLVRGEPRGAVVRLLGAPQREALLALHALVDELELSGRELVLLGSGGLPRVLAALAATERVIAELRGEVRRPAGPYR